MESFKSFATVVDECITEKRFQDAVIVLEQDPE